MIDENKRTDVLKTLKYTLFKKTKMYEIHKICQQSVVKM